VVRWPGPAVDLSFSSAWVSSAASRWSSDVRCCKALVRSSTQAFELIGESAIFLLALAHYFFQAAALDRIADRARNLATVGLSLIR